MTRARRGLLAATFVLALFRPAFAGLFGLTESAEGGQPAAFLDAAASARPVAMGGANTAIADDATGPFWNASGLSQIQRFDAVTSYSKLGEDASLGSGGFALPTSRLGTFSINYVGLQSGSFKRRDENNRDLGTFQNDASAFLLSQGFSLSTRWAAGYSLKAIRENIAGFSDTGYGADVGFLYRPHPMWQAGLAFQNLVRPSITLRSEAETLPTEMRLGGQFAPSRTLTLALDTAFVQHRATPQLGLGLEWRAADPLDLRLGANDREITAGIGLMVGSAGFDYAFGFPNGRAVRDELGLNHRITLHLRFGQNVMAGSYRDLARRREEQRTEILAQDTGVDNVKALRRRMPGWNERMDAQTFADVEAARDSLRELAFRDPLRALEAQAYITHFQGRYQESARLFDRLTELKPHNRHFRRDAAIARERADRTPNPVALASAYDALDAQYRKRREELLAQREKERQVQLAQARANEAVEREAESAGGAGASAGSAETGRSDVPARDTVQLAFLSPGTMPPLPATRPPIQRPVAPPPVAPKQVAPPPVAPEPVRNEPAPATPAKAEPAPAAPETAPEPEAPSEAPAAVAPPAQQPPPAAPPVAPVVEEAKKSFASGDYAQSYVLSKRALKEDPNDVAAARQAILASAVAGAQATITDPRQRVNVDLVQAQVDRSLSLYDRGVKLNAAGRRESALNALDAAVRNCPANYLARDLIRKINDDIEEEKWRKILNNAKGYR